MFGSGIVENSRVPRGICALIDFGKRLNNTENNLTANLKQNGTNTNWVQQNTEAGIC